MNPLHALAEHGQAVWLDYIDRRLLSGGGLRCLAEEDGLRGVTSNPSIFHKAISSGEDYDPAIRALLAARPEISTHELYEALAVADIREATDVLRPVWERTRGEDGYVSLEVSPHLAHDTEGTLAEARKLSRMVDRPNLMIKVPATPEGIPAIEELLAEGIHVNITLMFSLDHYEQVAHAYLRGLARATDPSKIASVASFFISRLDTVVDARLEQIGTPEALALRGRAAIANARLAYRRFVEIFEGEAFAELRSRGARVQRPLWASTSTKNPAYRDVLYVEELIGRHTVNTLPPATLEAFREHGEARESLRSEADSAAREVAALEALGIDFREVTEELQRAGVEAFASSFDALLADLETKRQEISAPKTSTAVFHLGAWSGRVEARLESWRREDFARRMNRRDPTLWGTESTPEIADRLGWLQLPTTQRSQVASLRGLVEEVRSDGIRRVVLLGMGGSSLAPEVFAETFGTLPGHPDLTVLDSTHPDAVAAIEATIEPEKTLFVVASKSGTTLESLALMRYFLGFMQGKVASAGRHFVAITDPESLLETEALERGFRALFLAPPDVGGRFSALSPFGLVPAALLGVDVGLLLERAAVMTLAGSPAVPEPKQPGLRLGAALAELAADGVDKLSFVVDRRLQAFPAWIEQLVAESTGKDGKGILPVVEPPGSLAEYGEDRLFAVLGEPDGEAAVLAKALEGSDRPWVHLPAHDPFDLGAEMFRWEIATAAAGSALGIHPFDQPDVQLAKELARKALLGGQEDLPLISGHPPDGSPEELLAWLDGCRAGDYLAIQAFVAATRDTDRELGELQHALRKRLGVAVTVGYGPRFLHSTGQLHKGGPATGRFLQLVDRPREDREVPGMETSFAHIIAAQADGDYRALAQRERPVRRIELGSDPVGGIGALRGALDRAG